VIDLARIAQLEKVLEEAKAELWKEDAERYRVVWREMSENDKERILEKLTNKKERVLFGLEAPEEHKGGMRPGTAGGDLTCSLCGKSGLTKRGLGLHMVRMHKGDETDVAA
jgi:alkylation response protein AidB-like acyl-CoA dehydrogenase